MVFEESGFPAESRVWETMVRGATSAIFDCSNDGGKLCSLGGDDCDWEDAAEADGGEGECDGEVKGGADLVLGEKGDLRRAKTVCRNFPVVENRCILLSCDSESSGVDPIVEGAFVILPILAGSSMPASQQDFFWTGWAGTAKIPDINNNT